MKITETSQAEKYYQALLNKDPAYIGIFYFCVKTTSVFCIATCRARKPKFENVEFYTSYKEALEFGYRPCKICKPTENANQAPFQVEHAISLVRDNPKEKITDSVLKQNGISPESVRRWFNKHYGITFHQFQRMYRINNAVHELKSGKRVTDSALDGGNIKIIGFVTTNKSIMV